MVKSNQNLGKSVGRRDGYDTEDFNSDISETLEQDKYRVVAGRQSSATNWYINGYGTESRAGDGGFLYLDLVDSEGNDITGKLRTVVYADERAEDPKCYGPTFDLGELRDAVNDSRTERPMLPVQQIGAKEDEWVALEVKADASEVDGNVVDESASDFNIPLSEVAKR